MSRNRPTPDKDLQKMIDESFIADESGIGTYNGRGFNDDKAVIDIIEKNKSAAEATYNYKYFIFWSGEWESTEYLPLFIAIKEKASFDVIDALYRAYPGAVKEIYEGGKTLLHWAAEYHNESPEVMQLLLDKWPAALEIIDNCGWTPLHTACYEGASQQVISLILERCPAAVKEITYSRETPLHAACIGDASLDVISLLLKHYPNAVELVTDCRDTALHLACRYNQSNEVVALLLEHWPAAVEFQDDEGNKPWDPSEKQKIMLSGVRGLLQRVEQSAATQIMNDFVEIEWWGGVWIFFDLYAGSVKCLEDIPLCVIPVVVSRLGCHCKLLTLWNMIRNRQDILKID